MYFSYIEDENEQIRGNAFLRLSKYFFILLLTAFFTFLGLDFLTEKGKESRLDQNTVCTQEFRHQSLTPDAEKAVHTADDPGEYLAVYWLESDFGTKSTPFLPSRFQELKKYWERHADWKAYLQACRALWNDLVYFPAAYDTSGKITVTYEDSWMFERTYKGERGHEGTDLMSSVNRTGYIPVVSMTDGIVEKKGWLELGGWRIGIRAPGNAYFYYAHLASYADLNIGDEIQAGDLLGFMGDTGYGKKEGTRGKFPVHLHLGIYLDHNGQEISVNPYPALRYTEDRKITFKGF